MLGEPAVFKANVEGPWIDPDAADLEALMRVAINCPSGAIHVARHDGAKEPAPKNQHDHGEGKWSARHSCRDRTQRRAHRNRATLCRCGHSNNKPYCDGSHVAERFSATGEPPGATSAPLAKRDGVVAITPYSNGPLGLAGPVEIVTGTGRTIDRMEKPRFADAADSGRKPFCDGSHARFGFAAP